MTENSEKNHFALQDVVEGELVRELIKDRKRERFWRNLRFFAGCGIVIAVLASAFLSNQPGLEGGGSGGYVALVRLEGVIAPGGNFSAETVLPLLEDAFSDSQAKGVVLDINSGGGTPVQAAIIHDAIVELKNRYHKSVVVVGEDMLASGAYYIAVAADKIYVNPNTITGSIGVIMKGFGMNELIKKLGVERRVIASGVNKDRLDPFMPQTKEDVEKIRTVMGEIHENFNQVVLAGRKDKLHAGNDILFSGDFWSGSSALKLGLVDSLGNLPDVLRHEFHVTRVKDYSGMSGIWKVLNQLGASLDLSFFNNQNQLHLLEKL